MVQTLGENAPRLPHQPGLHGVADLLWRGMLRQRQVQSRTGQRFVSIIRRHPQLGSGSTEGV